MKDLIATQLYHNQHATLSQEGFFIFTDQMAVCREAENSHENTKAVTFPSSVRHHRMLHDTHSA